MSTATTNLKLFMVMLGSKPPQRNVEQHDFFFGIAYDIQDLVPAMKAFWAEAGNSLHMDGWRQVNYVNNYKIEVVPRSATEVINAGHLFFINLGGYQTGKLEEQHYTVLTVQADRAAAVKEAKRTVFFKTNTIKGANSHIDEKYGVDVDDVFKIEEILLPEQKQLYQLQISPTDVPAIDEITLGYFRLDKLKLK